MLEWWIELVVDGCTVVDPPEGVESLEGTWVDMARQNDKLAALVGDGKARVEVELAHKLGAENFSSVMISTRVSLTCNQDEATQKEAAQAALDAGMEFIEDNMPLCYDHITALINRLAR